MARIISALSGGVDSAVATARMLDDGHDVMAVHLVLHKADTAVSEARSVAKYLGVPFEVWDLSDVFQRQVLECFVGEYATGRTPNPCVMCNRTIKFGELLRRASELGFDGLVTGHYARVIRLDDGAVELQRAVHVAKDQSYVLSVLTQDCLRRVWLPLGASAKSEVREEAVARGLPVAEKSESMDLCFVPDGDTGGWLAQWLGTQSGEIVDEAGDVLGRHDGIYRYTIGQRRGLNLRQPADDGQPRFVVGLDGETGQVVVGPRAHLEVWGLLGDDAVWTCGVAPDAPFEAVVQVRAHSEEHAAEVVAVCDGRGVEVRLHSPIIGVAPGQTVALYDGTRVVGSARIARTIRDAATGKM